MRAAIFTLAALLVLSSSSAHAALVRVDFAGTVESFSGYLEGTTTAVSPADAEALLGGSIHAGTRFSGSFMYDDTATLSDGYGEGGGFDGIPPSPAWALYFLPNVTPQNPPAQVHGEIGGFMGDGAVMTIDLWDNELLLDGAPPSQTFLTGGFGPPPPAGQLALREVWMYAGGASSGAPLHGTSLVAIPWSLESFPDSSARWIFSDGTTRVIVSGSVDYLVPEPAGAGLVALAACALLASRRRLSEL